MSISLEAAAAHDSLRDDKELIHTFEVPKFLFNYNRAHDLLTHATGSVITTLQILSCLYIIHRVILSFFLVVVIEVNSTGW